jgi:hypothetical protein
MEVPFMDDARAFAILSALANGVHPATGEVFPADSPYQDPDTIRALYVALRRMEGRTLEGRRRSDSDADRPTNAGKAWTPPEDEALLKAFDAGQTLEMLAQQHGRTSAGIRARLEKHGRLEPQQPASTVRRWPESR